MPEKSTAKVGRGVDAFDEPAMLDEGVDLEREKLKNALIDEICFLSTQKAAVVQCIEDRKERLRLLMSEDGDRRRTTPAGSASFQTKNVYSVRDRQALAELFEPAVLADICRPTKAFIDAAKLSGIDYQKAISAGLDETFKVEPARSKQVRDAQKSAMAKSAKAAEKAVSTFMCKMEGRK